jgi:hypothetical protein
MVFMELIERHKIVLVAGIGAGGKGVLAALGMSHELQATRCGSSRGHASECRPSAGSRARNGRATHRFVWSECGRTT